MWMLPGIGAGQRHVYAVGLRQAECPRAAQTPAQHVGMGYRPPDGAFRVIIVQEKRHEQGLADYRCRTRDGGGYR